MSDDKEIHIGINGDEGNSDAKKADEPEAAINDESEDKKDTVDTTKANDSVDSTEAIPTQTEEEKLREQLIGSEEKLLLAMADFENFKKRQARRQEEFYRTANDSLLTKLLDVIDNFERAIAHAEETPSDGGLLDGTKLILKQLHDILAYYQIKPIEAVGQTFDPNLHEALMQTESDEFEDGQVAIEIARGYKLGERVLRHSKVGVSKGTTKAGEQATDTDDQKTDESETK